MKSNYKKILNLSLVVLLCVCFTSCNKSNTSRNKKKSFLVITHYQRLLDYIKPDFVHVLSDGKIVKTGCGELAEELEKTGYKELN